MLGGGARLLAGMSVYFPRTPGEFESRFCSSIAAVAAWCVFLRKYYALAVTLSAQVRPALAHF